MRRLVTSTLLLVAVTTARAEMPAIEWSGDRPLSWDDFVGSVPGTADATRVASTASALSWSYESEIEWSGGSCKFRILSIDSKALFHPDGSWVRTGHRNDAVLQHEQGHFDITKIYERRFAASSREFVGSERPCSGRSQRAAVRGVEQQISEMIGAVYEEIWRQCRLEQDTYDAETTHGTDADAQAQWSRRLEALLHQAR